MQAQPQARLTPEAVFDCNVFLRATVQSHGPAYTCLSLLGAGLYTLFLCRPIMAELSDVLHRPSLREKFPRLTDENVTNLFQEIERHAVEVINVPETFRYSRDPDDEVYVNLALVTGAQYLVTYDRDLLDLMHSENEESRSFRHRFPALQIVDPQTFLAALSV